ncbi:hypothetical protein [Actinoplanes couchii]|uniref:Uncharacterized protein n=1 Tax=Actinoplanes couchii TaxID=403638 RepID=A0ABQ3XSR7_9ACTN|nr:hypothetical protein [Actinoplanes couchii]MDR6324029.1 hypothetical protein [Actinoplanes couchii]GID61556.1 hypothetical protein Aco03nite_099600 [Actinoplanes couchii]
MTSRSNFLVAVLVPATATTATINAHLAGPMRVFMPGVIDRYRLGGGYTGAWDPDYDPRTDPTNWRPCTGCAATGMIDGQPCPTCRQTPPQPHRPGMTLAGPQDWTAHPGDIVTLTRLLDTSWRYPQLPADTASPSHRFSVPDAYADAYGMAWIGGPDTGETPGDLQRHWDALLDGHRHSSGERFDPHRWAVAIVDAHWRPEDGTSTMPVTGSVVLITDPQWAEDDAAPDQLYVVIDDFRAPYYQLLRLGEEGGPQVPGYALTEVDPARIRLDPAPDGTPPYPPQPATTDS